MVITKGGDQFVRDTVKTRFRDCARETDPSQIIKYLLEGESELRRVYASTGSPCPFRLDLNSLSVEISSPIRQLGVEAAVAPAMPVEEEGEEPSSPMDVHETHELGKHEKQEVMEPSQPLQDETSSDIMSPILAVLHDELMKAANSPASLAQRQRAGLDEVAPYKGTAREVGKEQQELFSQDFLSRKKREAS